VLFTLSLHTVLAQPLSKGNEGNNMEKGKLVAVFYGITDANFPEWSMNFNDESAKQNYGQRIVQWVSQNTSNRENWYKFELYQNDYRPLSEEKQIAYKTYLQNLESIVRPQMKKKVENQAPTLILSKSDIDYLESLLK
jgi:hypothetical protein